MSELVLHQNTFKQLTAAAESKHHAFLFVGPDGLGKTTTANRFAIKLLGDQANDGDVSRWIYQLKPIEDKKISLYQIKEMSKFANQSKPMHLQSKVIIVDEADNIGIEAQNSLLMMLEESPADTVFILVATNTDSLLTTVISRLQIIRFYEPSRSQVEELATEHTIDLTLLNTIGRRPAWLLDKESHDHFARISNLANSIVSGDLEDKLTIIAEINDKKLVEELLDSSAQILVGMQSELVGKQGESLLLAQSHLYNNGNPKFVLETLALELE